MEQEPFPLPINANGTPVSVVAIKKDSKHQLMAPWRDNEVTELLPG